MSKIKNIFTKILNPSLSLDKEEQRAKFVMHFSLVAVVVFTTFGLFNIISGFHMRGTIGLIISIVVLLNVLQIRILGNTSLGSNISVIVAFATLLFIYFDEGIGNVGYLWMFTFPVIAFFLSGKMWGVVWVGALIFSVGIIGDYFFDLPYDITLTRQLVVSLIVVTVLIYFYESLNERSFALLREHQLKLVKSNKQLSSEVHEREEAQKNLSGSLKDIESKNQLLDDTTKAMMNILDDVADEKRNLADEKEKLKAILQSIGDGVLVLDESREVLIMNSVAEGISGYKVSEVRGKHYEKWLKFIDEKTRASTNHYIEEVYNNETITTMGDHTLLVRKDGSEVAVEDSAAPIVGSSGRVLGIVIIFRDDTKEREIDKMKSEFVSVASHQLRTPLTGIKWLIELLLSGKAGPLNEKQQKFVEQISESNQRLVILVNDLLNVSRIDTGRKFDIVLQKQDIVPMVKEMIEELRLIAERKGIKIKLTDGFPESREMMIDKEKLGQVVHNFVSNAIKYSPDNSEVEVFVEEKDSKFILGVRDHGMGIPKEQQEKIFTRFFRADNVLMTKQEGTGLGLYIAKAIIEGHFGEIWFESEEGKGSTFFFSLPTNFDEVKQKMDASMDALTAEANKVNEPETKENETK